MDSSVFGVFTISLVAPLFVYLHPFCPLFFFKSTQTHEICDHNSLPPWAYRYPSCHSLHSIFPQPQKSTKQPRQFRNHYAAIAPSAKVLREPGHLAPAIGLSISFLTLDFFSSLRFFLLPKIYKVFETPAIPQSLCCNSFIRTNSSCSRTPCHNGTIAIFLDTQFLFLSSTSSSPTFPTTN